MTHDKNVYHADISVGADGVHSVTRSEARRIASSIGQLPRPLHLTSKYSAVGECPPESQVWTPVIK